MERQKYPSDLTDDQWALIEPLIPRSKAGTSAGGHPRTVTLRAVVNGILYLVRSGCSWRMLPHDFPPWGTVYYYRRWRIEGVWEKIHNTLSPQVREAAGREATPSAAIVDSQRVKTTEKGGPEGTMLARRSTVVSATSWLTPWG